MATTDFRYATQTNFKDYFPHLVSMSDNKNPVYNWTQGLSDFHDGSIDLYFTHNTGLISQLFWDGAEVDKITFNTTETTQVKVAITPAATSIDIDDTTSFGAGDILSLIHISEPTRPY